MRFNFSKISAIGASVLLTGMTMGVAAAAAYPAPFIQAGVANVAVVYGTGAGVSSLDLVEAANIQSNLQSKMGSAVSVSSTISGDAKSLASGSDLLYLLDDLSENVGTITKDDLPTVLADGDFVDNDGTSWEFEQTIVVGTSTTNRFSFGNSDSDFDDPALMLELATSTSSPMYTWTLNFDKATNLNASISEGEELTLFGKTYTIGTATTGTALILLGGADSTKISVGETATMTVDDIAYSVTLDGLSSATTTQASITIDGETKTFTEGQTKNYIIDGVELNVYAKTVFRTGDDLGHIEIELGSDKLTFESGDAVQVGADNDDIDGTLVTLTGTTDNVMGSITKITIAVATPDNDANHVLVGESFTDPVFGTLRLEFSSVGHGPVFDGESDTGTLRSIIELRGGGSRELEVSITDSAGVTKIIPFSYEGILQDDSRNPFVTVEGNNLTDDDYFFLNSGDYQHLMQVSKVNIVADAAKSDLEIQDQFTGTKYLIENKDFNGGQNITINSQTYTFTNTTRGSASAAGFKITRAGADAVDKRAIFPYLELIAGEDFPRVTFINQTNLINDEDGDTISAGTTGTAYTGRTYELPTGNVQFRIVNYSAEALGSGDMYVEYGVTPTGSGTTTWDNVTGVNTTGINWTSIRVGEGWYTFASTNTNPADGIGAMTVVIDNVTVDEGFDDYGVALSPVHPMIMYIEDKDKSDGENRNVVILNTTDSSTYSKLSGSPLFSGDGPEYDTETWDTTEYVGYLTNYGTYILRDRMDTDQHLAKLTYGSDQMYADVFFAEEGAVISPGTTGGVGQLGDVLVKDVDVSTVSTKNLIVVGGSCINSAAASLVGGAHCGASWTTATNIGSGEFLIKAYASSTITSKHALLVAGYAAADTVNAATYLRTKAVDTSKEYKGTSSTSAELVTTTT